LCIKTFEISQNQTDTVKSYMFDDIGTLLEKADDTAIKAEILEYSNSKFTKKEKFRNKSFKL